MEFRHIRCQILRDHNTPQTGNRIRTFIKGKALISGKCILAVCRRIIHDLAKGKAGRNLREYFVDYTVDSKQIRGLCLFHHLLDHKALPLCAGKVSASRGPDPCICGGLRAVQQLHPALCYRMCLFPC